MANNFNMMEILEYIRTVKVDMLPIFTDKAEKLSAKKLKKMLDKYTYIHDYGEGDGSGFFTRLSGINRRTAEIVKQIEMANMLINDCILTSYFVTNDNPDKEQTLVVLVHMLGLVKYSCQINITRSDLYFNYLYKLRFITKDSEVVFNDNSWIDFGIRNQNLLTVLFSPCLSNKANRQLFNEYMNYPKYRYPIEGKPINISLPENLGTQRKKYNKTQVQENRKIYTDSLDEQIKSYSSEHELKRRCISVPNMDSVIYYIENNFNSTIFAAILLFNDPLLNKNAVLKNDKFDEILKIFRQQLFDEHNKCHTLKPAIILTIDNADMEHDTSKRKAHFIARILQCLAGINRVD